MGFIPEEWFNFFYEKTGVTGPYVFGVGLLTTLLSKEIWVIDHGFAEVIGFYGALWFLTRTIGPKFANWMDKRNETTTEERFIKPIRDAKETAQKTIAVNEKAIWREEGLRYLWDAKRENVGLQLEAAYRQRLNEIFKDIKRRLDYQVEVGSVKRRFEQQHLVNWVVHNVKQSITPQQETASIKDCIANLKRLAAANAPPAAPAPAK
nr:hypothetical protein BaRGS_004724 [Batillaria attramentaria]